MTSAVEYRGKIDHISETGVAGWAVSEGGDGRPLDLNIYYHDALIGTVRAEEEREDLTATGKGACAFNFQLPNLDNFKPDHLNVLIKGTNIPLKRAWAATEADNANARSDLADLTQAVILTRKVLLAASSRNERALQGMTETVGKITPQQITDALHSLSYQQMQTQAAVKSLQASAESLAATKQMLLEQTRKTRSLVRWTLFFLIVTLAVLGAQLVDWTSLAEMLPAGSQ